jgi:hypothetical protein
MKVCPVRELMKCSAFVPSATAPPIVRMPRHERQNTSCRFITVPEEEESPVPVKLGRLAVFF